MFLLRERCCPCFTIDTFSQLVKPSEPIDDFIAEFPQLQKFYTENFTVKELSDILTLPVDQMIKAIERLPKGAVDTLKKIAANQVSLGQIDSVRTIKALDEFFGTDLNLISEIFQEQ